MKAILAILCLCQLGCVNPWDEHLPFTEWDGTVSMWTPHGRISVIPYYRRQRPSNPTPEEAAANVLRRPGSSQPTHIP